jgi:hypothetical protein
LMRGYSAPRAIEAWNRRREPPASAIVHEDVTCDIQKVQYTSE